MTGDSEQSGDNSGIDSSLLGQLEFLQVYYEAESTLPAKVQAEIATIQNGGREEEYPGELRDLIDVLVQLTVSP